MSTSKVSPPTPPSCTLFNSGQLVSCMTRDTNTAWHIYLVANVLADYPWSEIKCLRTVASNVYARFPLLHLVKIQVSCNSELRCFHSHRVSVTWSNWWHLQRTTQFAACVHSDSYISLLITESVKDVDDTWLAKLLMIASTGGGYLARQQQTQQRNLQRRR